MSEISLLPEWAKTRLPIIGMLHAPPLPGSPRYSGDPASLRKQVLHDAAALAEGGVDGLMLENFGDAPFFPGRVPAVTIAQLTALGVEVRRMVDLPLGINVLRNDGLSALAVANAVGAAFVRVNVFTGARVTDQGVIEGIAHDLLRERVNLRSNVRIFADASVKHSAPLGAARPLREEIADMVSRGGADAIVISGSGTGRETSVEDLREARAAAGERPVFVGSGLSTASVARFFEFAHGAIVGTAFKADRRPENPIDVGRVVELMAEVRRLRAG